MSIMSLNCRGAGMAGTIREIRDLVQTHAPSILCIVETQLHRSRVEGLARMLGFDKAFVVSSSGRSGGLGIFWNNNAIKNRDSPVLPIPY
jgi:exonuclease III